MKKEERLIVATDDLSREVLHTREYRDVNYHTVV